MSKVLKVIEEILLKIIDIQNGIKNFITGNVFRNHLKLRKKKALVSLTRKLWSVDVKWLTNITHLENESQGYHSGLLLSGILIGCLFVSVCLIKSFSFTVHIQH